VIAEPGAESVSIGVTRADPQRPAGSFIALASSQLVAGIGVASGIAVGGVLAEDLSGMTAMAGLAQTASVLGAGIVAIPLSGLAVRFGRSKALVTGYVTALLGVFLVFAAVASGWFWLLIAGMGCFGAASASGLQSRFAATEVVSTRFKGTAMSLVMWAATIGSVAGPNLSSLGSDLGAMLGVSRLVGPYFFSGASFASACLILGLFLRVPRRGSPDQNAPTSDEVTNTATIRSWTAIRQGMRDPQIRFAIAVITASHMIMVGVMVMTPVHLHHLGFGLDVVGLVISIHILGMYGASPIMGRVADRLGPRTLIVIGCGIFVVALLLGGLSQGDMLANTAALGFLGLGWSAGMIGGSTLLTTATPNRLRVPLQGATDAVMNFGAAGSAALAGTILGIGGIAGLNLAAAVVLVAVSVLGVTAHRARANRM
jgi:MFS family permease